MKKLVYSVLFLLAMTGMSLILWFNGCNTDVRLRIGATYMTMNNPFYSVIDEELRLMIESRGDILLTRDPALDQERQNEEIDDLLKEGIDLLVINPVDFKQITSALERVREAGVPVVVVDSQVSDPSLVACTIASDNYKAGVLCAEHMMRNRQSANIVLLEHPTAQSAVDRIQGFCDAIQPYPQYHITGRSVCSGQLELAMPAMQSQLNSNPDIDVVMALNDPSALGAMAALKENGALENAAVYGVDGTPEAKNMILEGVMTATVAQSPIRIGQTTAQTVYKILSGEAYEEEIVLPVELITADNVRQFDINGWQ